jgi:two-component system, sporulation sensor kinase B
MLLKDLIINISLLLSTLFFYQVLWLDNPKVKNKCNIELFTVICMLLVFLCMSFPFCISPGFIFDLRTIPLIIGSLYGGYRATLLLLSGMIAYRFILGGSGFYVALMCTLHYSFALFTSSPSLTNSKQNRR